jgi:hypothetical protein
MFPTFPPTTTVHVSYSVCHFNYLLIFSSDPSCYQKSVREAPLGNIISFGRSQTILVSVCRDIFF